MPEFKVNDIYTPLDVMTPDVAIDAPGNFIITWIEINSISLDVMAQRYGSNGEALGQNFKVNDSNSKSLKKLPKITMNLSREHAITWIELRDSLNIYLQCYDQQGNPDGDNFKVQKLNNSSSTNLDVAGSHSGCIALTWDGYECKYDSEILVTILNQQREIIKEKVKADYDYSSSLKEDISIAASRSGNFIISWNDFRFCDLDIFAQRFDGNGEFQGTNFKVNHGSPETEIGYLAEVSMDSFGNSVVIFSSHREIYLQRYDLNGQKLSENTCITDDIYNSNSNADVAMNSSGDFVVIWSEAMVCCPIFIRAQLFDSQGNKVDSNFLVSNVLDSTHYKDYPKVAINSNGNFVIVWEKHLDYPVWEIWGQLYDQSGEEVGNNFMISDSTVCVLNHSPDVGMDKEGNFIVSWDGRRNVLIQRFKSDGSKLGSIIKVIDSQTPKTSSPAIAVKSTGEFMVTWTDSHNNNPDIYAWRFNERGKPMGASFRVNNENGENVQISPAIATNDTNYYFSWLDNRIPGTGYDIFCNIISFEGQTFVPEEVPISRTEILILQNYPNPFNQLTKIEFTLNHPEFATLTIYNILGQKIKTLLSGNLPAGYNSVIWNGKDDSGKEVASGVYFYTLEVADYFMSRKLVLLK